MIAIIGLLLTVLALAVSLGFNYLQYRWRNEERAEREQERNTAETEQRRRERMPPEIYNLNGNSVPIRITGSQHSGRGPFVDVWGGITVVNPTPTHIKIKPQRLEINGVDWKVTEFSFHLKSNDRERYDRISMMGNDKEDYFLHLLFSENAVPRGTTGELWLTSSNRGDDPFSIPISFS